MVLLISNGPNCSLFVNGHQVPTDKLDSSSWNQIDISDVTVNGDNRLQVSTVKETQATFEVKIGYPTLIDGTKDYADNDNFKLVYKSKLVKTYVELNSKQSNC